VTRTSLRASPRPYRVPPSAAPVVEEAGERDSLVAQPPSGFGFAARGQQRAVLTHPPNLGLGGPVEQHPRLPSSAKPRRTAHLATAGDARGRRCESRSRSARHLAGRQGCGTVPDKTGSADRLGVVCRVRRAGILVMSCIAGARTLYGPVYEGPSRKPPGLRQNRYEFSRRSGDRAAAHRRHKRGVGGVWCKPRGRTQAGDRAKA